MNKELEDYIEGNKPCVNDSHINKNWKEGAKWALSDPKAIELAGLVEGSKIISELDELNAAAIGMIEEQKKLQSRIEELEQQNNELNQELNDLISVIL